MPYTIDRIIAGDFFPSYLDQSPAEYERMVEEHVERLKRRGVTHVMVNQGLVCIPRAMEPENPYFEFCSYGYSLDKFVTSSYNEGIFFEGLLAENRRLLLHNAALARKYGFRCAIRCVEPTFMMERFYQRHPALRGPRVDNPSCSTMPVFALCPLVPDTQDHYRQLIRKMLELVPEIDEMHIFTNDSGGGFCYSSHLYSGANGPGHCHDVPTGQQAQVFCRTLVEGGRTINPEFRVLLTSGLSPKEKRDFLDGMPEGTASSVYGAFAWGGGLEDRWGTQAVGPVIFGNPDERRIARTWQYADYEARIRQVKEQGGIVYANYNSDYYTGDDPRPYETHEIVCQLLDWGVTNFIGGVPGTSRYSANTAVFLDAKAKGHRPTDTVVREIATEWVGTKLSPVLCEAWRLNDEAVRVLPIPPAGHLLMVWAMIRYMPILPDEGQVPDSELEYFRHALQSYDTKMREQAGGVWRILHYDAELKPKYLTQYQQEVFPRLEHAVQMLDEVLASPELTTTQRDCLTIQRRDIAGVLREHRHYANWIAASLHRIAGETAPAWVPALPQIIQAEIDLYIEAGLDPNTDPRLRLMCQHRDDPIVRVDLSAFPPNKHLGLRGWTGAHEIDE